MPGNNTENCPMSVNKFTQIIQASLHQPELMLELEKFRRDITVMFTDIKGSTAYFEKYGDLAGVMMVHTCNELLRERIEKNHGVFVKTIGDAVLATFEDPKDSVLAAIDMQQALRSRNEGRGEKDQIHIRIGLNYGSGVVKTNDVFGDVVNVASRVESAAQPDQILMSDTVNQRVTHLDLFKIVHVGRFSLKGKEGASELFEVLWDEQRKATTASAHLVTPPSADVAPFVIQDIVRGAVAGEWKLQEGTLTIGQRNCDIAFPQDTKMAPEHAKLVAEKGQFYVEDIAGRGVFVRLISTYTLQNKDIILMGTQMFRFKARVEAIAAAANTGTAIMDLASMLNKPVAELLRIHPDGSEEGSHYPLNEEEVTFGRNSGTYVLAENEFMSRTHARVYHRGENFFLDDLSRNGTFIKVQGRAPVPVGASVVIGSHMLKIAQ